MVCRANNRLITFCHIKKLPVLFYIPPILPRAIKHRGTLMPKADWSIGDMEEMRQKRALGMSMAMLRV